MKIKNSVICLSLKLSSKIQKTEIYFSVQCELNAVDFKLMFFESLDKFFVQRVSLQFKYKNFLNIKQFAKKNNYKRFWREIRISPSSWVSQRTKGLLSHKKIHFLDGKSFYQTNLRSGNIQVISLNNEKKR